MLITPAFAQGLPFGLGGDSGGMITSLTSEVMIFPKAAPMMMPTAMSSTLPFIANSLNSFSMV